MSKPRPLFSSRDVPLGSHLTAPLAPLSSANGRAPRFDKTAKVPLLSIHLATPPHDSSPPFSSSGQSHARQGIKPGHLHFKGPGPSLLGLPCAWPSTAPCLPTPPPLTTPPHCHFNLQFHRAPLLAPGFPPWASSISCRERTPAHHHAAWDPHLFLSPPPQRAEVNLATRASDATPSELPGT